MHGSRCRDRRGAMTEETRSRPVALDARSTTTSASTSARTTCEAERVLIDPMIPPEGLGGSSGTARPSTCSSPTATTIATRGGCARRSGARSTASGTGCYELEGRGPVEPFDFGDELPGGVVVHEVDAICPDETALYIPRHRALACADGVVRWRGGGRARVRARPADGRPRADQARPARGLPRACSSSTSTRCCWPTAGRS